MMVKHDAQCEQNARLQEGAWLSMPVSLCECADRQLAAIKGVLDRTMRSESDMAVCIETLRAKFREWGL